MVILFLQLVCCMVNDGKSFSINYFSLLTPMLELTSTGALWTLWNTTLNQRNCCQRDANPIHHDLLIFGNREATVLLILLTGKKTYHFFFLLPVPCSIRDTVKIQYLFWPWKCPNTFCKSWTPFVSENTPYFSKRKRIPGFCISILCFISICGQLCLMDYSHKRENYLLGDPKSGVHTHTKSCNMFGLGWYMNQAVMAWCLGNTLYGLNNK